MSTIIDTHRYSAENRFCEADLVHPKVALLCSLMTVTSQGTHNYVLRVLGVPCLYTKPIVVVVLGLAVAEVVHLALHHTVGVVVHALGLPNRNLTHLILQVVVVVVVVLREAANFLFREGRRHARLDAAGMNY